jgi:thiamine-monophosphate kinase
MPNESTSGEFAFIDWLRQRTPAAQRVLLGPGDDTAVVQWPSGPCLITTDMLLEGSCFLLEDTTSRIGALAGASGLQRTKGTEETKGSWGVATPRQVGRKSMAVNLSDIAAMAGRPVAAVVSVGLPRRRGRALAEELYLGMREMADAFDTAIVGGDTNSWDGPLVVSITVVGEPGPGGVIQRAGARPGDWLLVTGPLGGSILGKHLDFIPRVREALALASLVPLAAMIDLSDGLAADVAKLCAESHCGAVLRAESIPVAPSAHQLQDGKSPLQHALGDGEDFELVFALAPEEARRLLEQQPIPGIALNAIGECVPEGLWLEEGGVRRPLEPTGYVHALE